MIPKYFNLYNISDDFDVKNFFLNKKIVIYSIDIETDYNGSQTESLKYIDKVLNIFNELKIPLSIFLEGSLIQNERSFLNNFKNNSLLDLNLHCYDHQTNGDTKDSLNKSLDLFTEKFGYKPSGYRANSYHLNKKLLDSLINEDFKWDSSILPAFSIGGNISKTFMKGDYFKINNLYEFPLAHYKGIRFAYNHSNQMILKKIGRIFDKIFKIPELFIYDMHMYDLFKVNSLTKSPLPKIIKLAYNYAWAGYNNNSTEILKHNFSFMKENNYEFMSLNQLYNKIINNEI